METQQERPAHSPIGGSTAKRWLSCPGSVRLSADCPNKASEYADEGTAAHSLASRCLEEDLDAWELTGEVFETETGPVTVDGDMVEAVQVLLDYARSRIALYQKDMGEKPQVWIEHGFDAKSIHPLAYGTADVVIYFEHWSCLEVIDYKHGIGVGVEIWEDNEPNTQCRYYGAAVLDSLDLPVERLQYTIVQPRHQHPDGPIRSTEERTDSLGEWVEAVLIPGAKATEDPDAPLHAGDHCQFCPARGICRVLQASFDEALKETPDELPGLEDWEIGERLSHVRQIKQYIKALEDEAFTRMMKGREVPNLKLVAKRSDRVWKDGAEDKIKKKYGDDAFDVKLKSPAAVEKLPGGAAIAKKWAFKPDTGLTLAPEDDKRQAVPVKKAEDVFSGVDC